LPLAPYWPARGLRRRRTPLQRGAMDFATFLIVAALLTWGWLLSRLKASVAGYRAVAAGGIVLVLYGALFGIAISTTGYYDSLRTGQPGTYRALERFFSPLPTLATMMVRQPVLVHVSNPTGYSAQVNYGMAGAGAATFAPGWRTRDNRDRLAEERGHCARGDAAARPHGATGHGASSCCDLPREERILVSTVKDRRTRIPIAVKRGLNELQLTARQAPSPTKAPDASAQLIVVEGLHASS
jgi:hypothetical protein